jgi:hypothetical protein
MFDELNAAEPASSSESAIEPVAQLFEVFAVVAVNAAREYCMIEIDTAVAASRALKATAATIQLLGTLVLVTMSVPS